MGLCGPKQSRRYLILDNLVIAFSGFVFLIVGGFTLTHGERFKTAVNNFCKIECAELGCHDMECSKRLPSCDCTDGTSEISGYFTSPAGGLVTVGVLSLLTSVLGCLGAIKVVCTNYSPKLKNTDGLFDDAALVADMKHVPDEMKEVFETKYQDFDWLYLESFLPEACYYANTTHPDYMVTNHPMCAWNGTCNQDVDLRMRVGCCQPDGTCDFDQQQCTSPKHCIHEFLFNVGTPVAICALLTLVLEICAVVWACIVRRETRIGGTFDPSRNHL